MSDQLQIPFNLIPTQPHLVDALNLLKRDVMLNLAAHHIGTVQSFNAMNQTCTVTINYPKTYFELDPKTGQYSPTLVQYPLLLDCPCIVLGGGTAALSLPIQAGDECLLLFNDRDLDTWFAGGAGAAVATPRLHSFSDGIALVGLRSSGHLLGNYDIARGVLRGGTAVVGVNTSNNKILLANVAPSGNDGSYTYSTTLNTLLQNLSTQLENLISAVNTLVTQTALITVTPGSLAGPSSPPLNAASITAVASTLATVNTQITTIATQIGGILE